MRRDSESNELLNAMVEIAIKEGRSDHNKVAEDIYRKIAPKRRRELTISRLGQQARAKFRRKLPKQPVIPGLEDEAERA